MVSTAAFHARVRGSVPGLGDLKETKLFLPHPRVKVSIVGSLRDREVASSVSDRQGSNFESCVWRTVSSQSFHHPQEVLLAQFGLYVHKGGLYFISIYLLNIMQKRPQFQIESLLQQQQQQNITVSFKRRQMSSRWHNTNIYRHNTSFMIAMKPFLVNSKIQRVSPTSEYYPNVF